jgi:uncharacterized protein (TIGR02147 family)
MSDLYKAFNYRDFLRNHFPSKGDKRGRRRSLAKALGCQTSFVSLVLTDRAHLNEDMIFNTARFLHLNGQETDFLLMLYHHERASSHVLRGYYQSKIKEIIEKRTQVKERVGPSPTIPLEIQAQYYSNWTYAAIHTTIINPQMRTIPLIAKKLNLSAALVEEHLNFLEKWNFVTKVGEHFEPGFTRLHLSVDSPFIIQHHRNWHLEAMRAVGEGRSQDLNYSGALSLSKEDAKKIREILLNTIGTIETQIKDSADEEIVGITLGYFCY